MSTSFTTNIPVCRICLAMDVSLITISGSLQSVYEKLASTTLHTADTKPEAACYICYAQLRKCQKFMLKATKAENVLNAVLEKNSMITIKSISVIDRNTIGLCETLALSIVECYDNNITDKVNVKTELHSEDVNIKELDDTLQPLQESSNFSDQIFDSTHSQDSPMKVEQLEVEEQFSEGGQLPEISSFNVLDSIHDDSASPLQGDTMMEACEDEVISDDGPAQFQPDCDTQLAEESHECTVCQRQFVNNEDLFRHFRTVHVSHTVEKPFKCRICDCRFKRHSDMLNHLRNHSGGKHYKCHICQQQCSRKYDLVKHIRTHTGEKCDTCESLLNNDTAVFLSHINTHNSEKPFKCSICYRRFNQKDALLKHCEKSYW